MRALLRFRRRTDVLLAVLDLGLAVLVGYLGYQLRFAGITVPGWLVTRYEGATLLVAPLWVVAARAGGLYSRRALRPGMTLAEPAFRAAVSLGVFLIVLNWLPTGRDVSRSWIALVTLGLLLGGVATRAALRRGRRALVPLGVGLERYGIVGAGTPARRLTHDLTRAAGTPFRIVRTLSPELDADALAAVAVDEHLDGLILTEDAAPRDAAALAHRLAGHGIDAFVAPRLGGLDMRVASIAMFHGVPLLRVAGIAPRRPAIRRPAPSRARPGVAILGTRGIPANYGGFETFAERLALHLVDRGVPVTVYCRRHHATTGHEWRGIRLVTLPTIRSKYLDTVVHTALSAVHLVVRTRIRSVVLCNAANAPVLPFLRLARRRVVMNVDGLEWRRGKWGVVGRAWYRLGEWLSVRASSVLVTDAEEVRTYYRVRHDTDSVMIPYGADPLLRHQPLPDGVDVPPDGFALYVSRWEPENNPLLVAEAHAAAGSGLALVMLGAATYDAELERAVRTAAAADAVLPGPLYGAAYRALQSNARCYVHATEVGGTHPALIEAMGAGNLCLVLDTPENREVAGESAWFFSDADDLAGLLRRAAALPGPDLEALRRAGRERAARLFSWTAVGDAYCDLLLATSSSRNDQKPPKPKG